MKSDGIHVCYECQDIASVNQHTLVCSLTSISFLLSSMNKGIPMNVCVSSHECLGEGGVQDYIETLR